MQINPHKYSQAFLTAVGLTLLVLTMILNHYHPRNQGIADLSHGSVYKIGLAVIDQAETVPSSAKFLKSIQLTSSLPSTQDTAPVSKLSNDSQPAPMIGDSLDHSQNCQAVQDMSSTSDIQNTKPLPKAQQAHAIVPATNEVSPEQTDNCQAQSTNI